jgi:tRNA(Arg) A34 adenosine deaminase TadA
MLNQEEKRFLERAIELSRLGMTNEHGGPFGSVITRNNEIVGEGYNMVISTSDPTAHAEIVAIREACRKLKTFHLHDCDIYTSCEPCPMCLGAIYWARPKRVFMRTPASTRQLSNLTMNLFISRSTPICYKEQYHLFMNRTL